MRKQLLITLCLLFSVAVCAQTTDIVYLKNGSIIKANVIEHVFGQSIKIETADGSIFVYREDEVLKIERAKATIAAAPASTAPTPVANNPALLSQTVTDIDGNIYRTVKIGQQIWFADNLRTTRYADGTQIMPNFDPSTKVDAPKYFFQNDEFVKRYGLLYNWAAAMKLSSNRTKDKFDNLHQGACPDGWHVPSYAEFEALFEGGGRDKKTIANIHNAFKAEQGWNNNLGGRNTNGFSAMPAGLYEEFGNKVTLIGEAAYFWTSDMKRGLTASAINSAQHALFVAIGKPETVVQAPYLETYKQKGMSMRCVKN